MNICLVSANGVMEHFAFLCTLGFEPVRMSRIFRVTSATILVMCAKSLRSSNKGHCP